MSLTSSAAPPPWEIAESQAPPTGARAVHPFADTYRFSLPGWHVWCGSVLQNPSGNYSLYFSCWPVDHGFDGWVTHSQIWRAVGSNPWGPFSHPHVVFSPAKSPAWDADNFHNVTVKQFGSRYFMYYTGNFGNGEWWVHRNNQRIGVAAADSPEGPWYRSQLPLLDVSPDSWDSLCVANPSVTPTPDGRVMMIYKGVTAGDLPYGSRVLHGVALADRPEGPFVKNPMPLFQIPGSQFPFEDPYIWFAEGRYRCLMKDMVGLPGSFPRATLLFESKDGVNWPMDDYRLVGTPHLETSDNGIVRVDRLERPSYFRHPEKPCLSFAVKPMGDGASFLVFLPSSVTARARAPQTTPTNPFAKP